MAMDTSTVDRGTTGGPIRPSEASDGSTVTPLDLMRWYCATDPETPAAALRLLYARDTYVGSGVLCNPHCPPDVLVAAARSGVVALRCGAAEHDATTEDVLMELAVDPDPRVRERVALRSSCPPHLRAALLVDADQWVRCAAALAFDDSARSATSADD